MIAEDSMQECADDSPNVLVGMEKLARGRVALMHELQASLVRSRQALLALDLAGIEQGTREQMGLSRKLEAEIRRAQAAAATERQLEEDRLVNDRLVRSRAIDFAGRRPELAEELSRSENEVRQALRLQSALLARAQRKLLVLANTLADPAVNYGPWLARTDRLPLASAWKRGGSKPGRQG